MSGGLCGVCVWGILGVCELDCSTSTCMCVKALSILIFIELFSCKTVETAQTQEQLYRLCAGWGGSYQRT